MPSPRLSRPGCEGSDMRDDGHGNPATPAAHVSVDLDPVDTHLGGYGFAANPCARIYEVAVPRLLDLLDRLEIRATLFVVARDAASQAHLWREAHARGHEIASHSLTHALPFATLPPERLHRELGESRERLEAVVGVPVHGFRAPGWDVTPATIEAVARAGYRYDASVLPSPVFAAGAALRLVLSGFRARDVGVGRALRFAYGRRAPYRTGPGGGLVEFPVAVSPVLRLPLTHTLWYLAPAHVCRRAFAAARRSGVPLSYQFHAVDLLGLEEDEVDRRLVRHPGMTWPLARKVALLEDRLRAVATDYRVETYANALERLAA